MIEKKLLVQAVKTLRELNEKHYSDPSKKKPLLSSETELPIYIQITLKKIPNSKSVRMLKIQLPHTLIKDSSEICLITGDVDKRNRKAEIEPDILHYKNLLDKHAITAISEVFTLRQLRTEYKPYEAKQKLLAAYDVFLADKKIAECLPKVLGRHFFKKRKFPIQINMDTPNLKQQVEKALSTKVFYLTGNGNSCSSEVAYLDMSDSEIFDNVTTMAKTLSDQLPGSWDNVMGMYLKTSLSKAIPVYMSYDNPSKVLINDDDDNENVEIDELSTVPNVDVKVFNDGRVETFSRKRKIEVDNESKEETFESGKKPKSKKKKEVILTDEGDNIISYSPLQVTKLKNVETNDKKCDTVNESKEETFESGKKPKSKKKREVILTDEGDNIISYTPLQAMKQKNMETNEKKCDTVNESKEETVVSSKKSKSKRKKEVILDDEDDSITYSPLQVSKKKNAETNEKKQSTEKPIESCKKSKSKRIKEITLSDDDDSIIVYSPLQVETKKNMEINEKKHIRVNKSRESVESSKKSKSKRRKEVIATDEADSRITYSPLPVTKKKNMKTNEKKRRTVNGSCS